MASSLLKVLASGRRASAGLLEQAQRAAILAPQNEVGKNRDGLKGGTVPVLQ